MRLSSVGRLLVLALAAGGCAALQLGAVSTRRALAQAAGALASSQLLPAVAEEKKAKRPKFITTDNGAVYFDLKEGGGYSPQRGDFVVVTYKGYLSNGKRTCQLSHRASRQSLASAPLCRVHSHGARASHLPLSLAWTRSLRFIGRSG